MLDFSVLCEPCCRVFMLDAILLLLDVCLARVYGPAELLLLDISV
jgi:hypothetical protein